MAPTASSTNGSGRASRAARNDDRNRIQVIARAAAVLRALAGHPQGIGLSDLVDSVELPRSTVHRIVMALQGENLVVSSDGGRVRLGPGLIRLAAAERIDLRAQVRPHLEELSNRLSETVDLSVLEGDSVLFIDQVSAPQRLRAVSTIGIEFPAHCTANGKALLAELPIRRIQEVLPAKLLARTPKTITSRAKLEAELKKVRRLGYATDKQEHTIGICALGATVCDSFGTEMAVSVPLPAQRFGGREEEISAALLETCATIEAQLGGLVDAG